MSEGIRQVLLLREDICATISFRRVVVVEFRSKARYWVELNSAPARSWESDGTRAESAD